MLLIVSAYLHPLSPLSASPLIWKVIKVKNVLPSMPLAGGRVVQRSVDRVDKTQCH